MINRECRKFISDLQNVTGRDSKVHSASLSIREFWNKNLKYTSESRYIDPL